MSRDAFELSAPVVSYLRRFARRRRLLVLLRRLGLTISVAGLVALASCMADRVLRLSENARWVLLVCVLVMLVVPVAGPFIGLFRRVRYPEVARRIERRTPAFAQRLVTLVSQAGLPPERRGSDEFLAVLSREVERIAGTVRVGRLLPLGRVAGPWFLASLTAALAVVGWRAEWLVLPQLARRLVMPYSGVPPVVTTHILVAPGPVRVPENGPVTIQAFVSPPVGGDVTLRVTSPEPAAVAMVRKTPQGPYEVTFPHVDRAFAYAITAGDAASPSYAVTVLHRPTVADARVRYVYPGYTRWPAATLSARDGLVEAPAGTRATLQIVSSEPLLRGSLTAPGVSVELRPTADPHVAEAEVPMTADQRYQVDLTSRDGITVTGAARLLVRPVADRPPTVRLTQPVDDLRLDPHAVLPVAYQAADDVGVAALTARVRVNTSPPKDLPIAAGPGARQTDGVYDLDLAPLGLKVGDVLGISVSVTDGKGQSAASEERHVLITPRTIDIRTYQRLADLRQANQSADALVRSLQAAVAACEALTTARAGADTLKKQSAVNQQLAGAAEAQVALRRALLGALARSDSPGLSTVLANLADALAVCAADTAYVTAGGTSQPETRKHLERASQSADVLRGQVQVIYKGQQAAATLADRSNLRAAATLPTTRTTVARVTRTLDRARADVTAAAVALGMDVNAPDLDARLQQLVDAAGAVTAAARPVSYAAAAREWARNVTDESFANRLDAAAGVEEQRPDADPARVADLRLIARAVRATRDAFDGPVPATRSAVEAREQMPRVVAVLESSRASTRPADRQAVLEARAALRRWAGDTDLLLAAAEAVNRQVQSGHGPPATEPAPATGSATAIRQVQEALAGMPEDLTRLLQAVDASRAARGRAELLRREAATAPAVRRPVAQRIARQAESARQGAQEVVSSAAKSLEPTAAGTLAQRLQSVAPEPAGAIDARLTPALRALQEAVGSPDAASVDTAADLTRRAIGQVQADLRRAQADLEDRGPTTRPLSPVSAAARGGDATGYERQLDAYFKGLARLVGDGKTQ